MDKPERPETDTLVDAAMSAKAAAEKDTVRGVHGAAGVHSRAKASSRRARDFARPPQVPGYELHGVLGRGGMGVVYEAKHVALKRHVALKMLLHPMLAGEEPLARFRLEAQVLASLAHPNIVQIYEIGDAEGCPYFALELVEGGTLWSKVKKREATYREAAELVVTIARAVHCAHQRGIVHRDLKPANILLTADGEPKVADFGIARTQGSAEEEDPDVLLGTPGYMAPETISTPWAATHAVDVFALGAILYALLAGHAPYVGKDVLDVLAKTLAEAPMPLRKARADVPKDLEVVCMKCLAKDPAERYPTAAAFADDLERFLHGEPILARQLGRAERVIRWCRTHPVPASALLATVLGACSTVAYMSKLSNDLAEATALQGAAQEIETLEKVTDYYTDNVVGRLNPHEARTSTHYRDLPGNIPVPATLTIELGEVVTGASQAGQEVRMYSDLPFHNRKDGGPHNAFEREALVQLRKDPSRPYYAFETSQNPVTHKPQMVLRYAKARVLKKACADCHNAHAESPKTDWKEGDVRGAIEVVRTLDADVERSRAGLRGAGVLVSSAFGLLLVFSGAMALSNGFAKKKAAPRG